MAGSPAKDHRDRFRGCLLGLAAGDAVGTTVEFEPRGSFLPLTDMTGGGPFQLEPGQWTDDTSMALCLATSLIVRRGFDPADQMNRYCRWSQLGYLSSNGTCFDIGSTVGAALRRYQTTGEPFSGSADPHSAGNGSLMRLAPVPMFFHPDRARIWHYCGESSRTTHGAQECIDACRLFGDMLARALDGAAKAEILFSHEATELPSAAIRAIAQGAYRDKTADDISGSGYVVHCLEAALWCFLTTDSFAAAILQAANLGQDADTTAAVCGQIAGAYYGESGIPAHWLGRLTMREEIAGLADKLYSSGRASAGR
ncbi:MAG TPA: ADP-ribosylglycohydrolase family protein [Candidatus Acidoferrum sp.]|nr:ADP-ribosylglycohydrolase family protein [Candidatus Acidoferrum sp.]